MKTVFASYQAPFGLIRVIVDELGVKKIALTPESWEESLLEFGEIEQNRNICAQVISQLDEYFSGKRRQFNLPFSNSEGPSFSQKVWRELLLIPYGETRSYSQIAQAIQRSKSCRAVGQANRRNPLPIIIPCHRVIGKNGNLTGYAGKGYLAFKDYLLKLEQTYK